MKAESISPGFTEDDPPKWRPSVIASATPMSPAGFLAGQWLGKSDPHCEKIGRICYAYEHGSDWERNWFRLLASHIGNGQKDVLERLALDLPFTADDLERIRSQKGSDEVAESLLKAPLKAPAGIVTTSTGRRMAIYYTSGLPGVFLGKKVFQHHDLEYSLIRISQRKWQLAANPDLGLSLESLKGSHQIDKMTISIGGRPSLLAIEATDIPGEPYDAHAILARWIASRL